nr:spore germination protein [Shouchella patagoniensis]
MDNSTSENLNTIKQRTGNSPDIITRTLKLDDRLDISTAIVYVEGLVDNPTINDFLVEFMENKDECQRKLLGDDALTILSEELVSLGHVKTIKDWDGLFESLLSGDTVIFVDGKSEALIASTKGGERRPVEQPSNEVTIRGSKEGFTESMGTNISLLRRIITNPDLWVEPMKIGTQTKTAVSIMYMNGIADKDIIEEVRNRLKRINIDSILESGYIESLIEDEPLTVFPTIAFTERPDVVAANLLEGRVAIFVNGTPFVLLAPALFIQFFQAPDDYYARFPISSAIRLLRVLMFSLSLIAPSVYVAVTTFHQEMIPTQLLIIIAAQSESVPFPAVVEAIIMEVTFEILREAGIRMPEKISSTISIVGALVIGQGAIQAGIVSPAMVIIVAITAIASLATPSFNMAVAARLIRFGLIISAAIVGFYGILLGLIMLIVHLVSLRSMGVPYLSPLAPFIPANFGDTLIRMPLWKSKERPRLISPENRILQGENQKPQPPRARGMVRADTKEGE